MKKNMFNAINKAFPSLVKYKEETCVRSEFKDRSLSRKHKLTAEDGARFSEILGHWWHMVSEHPGVPNNLRDRLHMCAQSFGVNPTKTFRCGCFHICPFCCITKGMQISKAIDTSKPGGIKYKWGGVDKLDVVFRRRISDVSYTIRGVRLCPELGKLEGRIAFFTNGKSDLPYSRELLMGFLEKIVYWDYSLMRLYMSKYLKVMLGRQIFTTPILEPVSI